MLKNIVNCKNCGAPLHYDKKNRKAICEYCSSEYHLDNLGMIEEYKVELEIMGQRRKFYIGEIEVVPIYDDIGRSLDGRMYRSVARGNEIRLELISY